MRSSDARTGRDEGELRELRLLLEEVCCDLCRFVHTGKIAPAMRPVQIHREFYLGSAGLFADVRVEPPDGKAYFLEVKHGYAGEALVRHLRRKYESGSGAAKLGGKVVLVIDLDGRKDWSATKTELSRALDPGLELEVWDETVLFRLLKDFLGVHLAGLTTGQLLDLRLALDQARGFHAFGASCLSEYHHDPLKAELLWQFGFWRLRELREAGKSEPRAILPPRTYRQVATLVGDLCAFSSYVRDTPDSTVIRESLTSFYSKSRYEIINSGGMLGGFGGDQVMGFFGIPDPEPGFERQALHAARSLLDIGLSVSTHWQRRIDRVQSSGGLRVGLALGDMEIISLGPFSRTHMGAIGDSINVAARLMVAAGPGEIVISNSFYQRLPAALQAHCCEAEPVEARNVGRIKAWKLQAESRYYS